MNGRAVSRRQELGDRTITVNGAPMALFTRRLDRAGSLTLGSNSDTSGDAAAAAAAAPMYVVFALSVK